MEFVKGDPYFCKCEKKIKRYPYLNKDIETDVLIIGGGIDGAIANYHLSKNYKVTLVDSGRIGSNCTTCATVLLEYQLDDFANDLKKELSTEQIIDVYNMGLKSIEKFDEFIKNHGNKCHFSKRPSLLYSNKLMDVFKIEKEYQFRKDHNFKALFYDECNNPFPFKLKAGIYCEDGGAEFNAYMFTKQVIESASNQKNIYEFTKVEKIENYGENFIAYTNYGEKIIAKKIVLATGFNYELLKNDEICERFMSYSFVTSPIENFGWKDNALIQDCLDPYHYLRLLPDNRIIYGGEDTPFQNKTVSEKTASKKYEKLIKDFEKMFPDLVGKYSVDYKFCGAFGQTDNNLGLIGESDIKNLYYFFSCGANGIINAMAGVEILDDLFNGKSHKLEKIFSPKRVLKK